MNAYLKSEILQFDSKLTLSDILKKNVQDTVKSQNGIIFIDGNGNEVIETYYELYKNSIRILNNLNKMGIKQNDFVIIQAADELHYIRIFWACILGGIIPIPLPVPRTFSLGTEAFEKLLKVNESLLHPYVVIDKTLSDLCKKQYKENNLKFIIYEDLLNTPNDTINPKVIKSEDIAYIQYSSGSTGEPKGVPLSHKNIVSNIKQIYARVQVSEKDFFGCWLPLTHDMGLIAFYLTSLYAGINVLIMKPEIFVKNPVLFLQKIKKHRITVIPSPNFALSLMVDKVTDQDLEKLDLSSVRLIASAAEPISSEVVRKFYNKFKKIGLKRNAIYQVYGLSEASAAAAMPIVGESAKSIVINRNTNMIGENIREVSLNDSNASEFAILGKPLDGMEIKVVNDDFNLLEEEQIGNILIKGPNVFKGYFHKKDISFTEDGFFQTGDLGFVKDGNVVITGRKKNVIFINGQNYYIEDVERIIKSENYCDVKEVVVTACFNDSKGKDDIIVFVEFDKNIEEFIHVHDKIQKVLFKSVNFIPNFVVPVKEVPRTSMGKLQRYKLMEQFNNHKFDLSISNIKNLLSVNQNNISMPVTSKDKEITNKVLNIAKKILRLNHINLNDSLFRLGFDSIKLISFVGEIKNEFSIDIEITDFENMENLEAIAAFVIKKQNKSIFSGFKYPQIVGNTERLYEPFDLTDIQMAYVVGRQEGTSDISGVGTHGCYEFITKLDIKRFNDAINKVIKRQPMLKAVINENGKQQILRDVPYYNVDVVDISNINEDKRNAIINNERKRMSHFVFKSDVWPLFEFKSFKLSEKEYYIFWGFDLIIADGSSLVIFLKEILKYYKHPDICLPELKFSFADYMYGYKKLKESSIYKRDVEYWKQKINDFPEAPQLPLIKDPTSVKKPVFTRIQKVYSNDFKEKLKSIVVKKKITLSVLLFTIYAEVLGRWSNQSRIAINSTVFNRYPFNKDVMDIIGDFTSILLIDVDLSCKLDFWTRCKNIQKNFLNALEHRHYDGVSFIRDIGKYKGISGKAIMPFVFTSMLFEQLEQNSLEFDEEEIELKKAVSQTPQVYLDFQVTDLNNKLSLSWDYVTDIFDKSMIENMFNVYTNILESIVNNKIECSIIPKNDKELIEKYNSTRKDFNFKLLHEMIDVQIEKTPNDIAVKCENKSITYRELGNCSNQVARYLKKQGFGRGDFIGVLAERRIETIVNIVGILKSGCAYVPIDPSHPKDRREYILENSKCKLLLVPELYDEKQLKNYDYSSVEYINQLNDIAYVIYTSGSTGKPKGVAITHKAVSNTIIDINSKFNVSKYDNIIGISSMCFDLSVYDIFGSLTSGATLVMITDLLNVKHIRQVLKEDNITIWNSVPAIVEMLIDNIKDSSPNTDYWNANRKYELNVEFNDKLRLVMLSGDWINLELPKKINENFPYADIISLGGATEASIWSIYYPIKGINKEWSSIPYGYPLSNQTIYILDFNMQECPVGIMGEVCIGGTGVAAYYLNEPEKTKNAFINHSKLGYIYKTGDYGVMHREGYVEFKGRKDHQVKIRGNRVELGEIENCLLKIPEVKNAVVIDRIDKYGEKYLCGYIVQNIKLDINVLNNSLMGIVPEYMMPSRYVQLKNIPLTPNGKVDKKRLPEPKLDGKLKKVIISPKNDTEEKLLEIWSEILRLGVDDISTEDDFFDLGGDSLKLARLISRINKVFKLEVQLRQLFKNSTIIDMSNYLQSINKNYFSEIKPISKKEYYEVSSAQKRMYILYQIDNKDISYNTPVAFELNGKVNVDYFQKVIDKLVQRHESFRTSFEMLNGEIVQRIKDKVETKIIFYDIQNVEGNKDKNIGKIIEKFVVPFNLSIAPLLRVGLIKSDEDRFILMFDTHHIILDGVSNEIIIKEFSDIYNKKKLPKLRIQYKDFAAWQNESLISGKLRKQEEYWINELKGPIPVLNLPTDYPRVAVKSFEGQHLYFEINDCIMKQIEKIKTETGTTLYMVLLAVTNVLLMKYSGQEDIIVGTPISGRSDDDLNKIVGVFVNTLALRNKPMGGKTFRKFLSEVKESALGAYENQDYPFEELVNKINVKRDMSRNPLFDVFFALQNMEGNSIKINEINVCPYQWKRKISKFDISIYGHEIGNKLKIEFEYCTKLYRKETIERFALGFKNILKEIIEKPDILIKDIDIMSLQERNKMLATFNNTLFEYNKDKTISELFEEQANKQKDATALIFGENKISYKELNSRSNQLARRLRQKDVKANDVVAIMVDRSLEMIIGILGVLKAGGAYLPIDPNYPSERVCFMIKDSCTKIILTQDKYKSRISEQIEKVDIMKQELYVGNSSNLNNINKFTDLAYVIYTSGSTGKPKGVMIEHHSAHNFIVGICNKINFKPNRRILASTTISFDIFFLETLLPLCRGMEVVIANELEQKDPKLLRQLISKRKVEMIQMTPSMLQMHLAEYKREYYESVNTLMIGGEALSLKLFKNIEKNKELKIYNMYGPTETTIWSTICELKDCNDITIGKPISNTRTYVMDKNLKICPIGVVGELYIGGEGLSRGYLNRPELSKEKFIDDPYKTGEKIYNTGDMALWLTNGDIKCIGRSDNQVKVRGYRIELEEIENKILEIEGVKEVIVNARENKYKEKYLCAYLVCEHKKGPTELRKILKNNLPEYMIPNYFINIEKFPLTPNGKINRKALPEPLEDVLNPIEHSGVTNEFEEKLVKIWHEVLGRADIGVNDNFFDLGGTSLSLVRLSNKLTEVLKKNIEVVTLFQYPTISTFEEYLTEKSPKSKNHVSNEASNGNKSRNIAVIGMSGRFPKSKDVNELWDNLKNGRELISHFSKKELLDLGIKEEILNDKNYVRASAALEDIEYFDADFFGYNPHDAKIMDPQIRIFEECAWEALEDAGYIPENYKGNIGLFAGASTNLEWQYLALDKVKNGVTDVFNTMYLSDSKFLPTQVAYKLNLKGPSVYVNTACSTSLVAIHMACQSIINGECSMAMAGGINATQTFNLGYKFEEGMIMSSDGYCRAFDEQASGTIFGNGVGIVVLKPLEKAIEDRDNIYAVIKGSSINNDGNTKVGFTAPSIEGQKEVIEKALSISRVNPESIGYVEAHGTGTRLGDPIEIEALRQSYNTDKKGYCAIGSIKTNMGHLDVAAGVAGFIKTVLALKNKEIPASLNYNIPNSRIHFDNTPFYVNSKLKKWNLSDSNPRRAGVSSFGIGGTNAHIILEEAPEVKATKSKNQFNMLVMSAKTEKALTRMELKLAKYIKKQQNLNLDDVAYTLAVGRKKFKYRSAVVCRGKQDAVARLLNDSKIRKNTTTETKKSVVFMFPGQGSQYIKMGKGLYENNEHFHKIMDYCFSIVERVVGYDIKKIIYGEDKNRINETEIAQLAIYIFEYSLAKLLMFYGIEPEVMIGHSIGEYIAATLAEVITLEDGIKLVTMRGKLMQSMPRGAMLSVKLSEKEVRSLINEKTSIQLAAVNSSNMCVVSGKKEDIHAFAQQLEDKEIDYVGLKTSHAYHSNMMEGASKLYKKYLNAINLNPPRRKYISNLTGNLISKEEATDSEYWVKHMLNTVRFKEGIEKLLNSSQYALIEVGPGKSLSTLVKANKKYDKQQIVENIIRYVKEEKEDNLYFLEKLSRMWIRGLSINWKEYYNGTNTRRISLPTYSFEKKRYWIDDKNMKSINSIISKGEEFELDDTSISIKDISNYDEYSEDYRRNLSSEYIEPSNEVDSKLVQIVGQILGISKIGIRDNFFELGADSLKCAMLGRRIYKETGVQIPISIILFHPTVEAVSKYISKNNKAIYSEIEKIGVHKYYEVSSAQKRMYILNKMNENSVGYNIPDSLEIIGELDRNRVKKAIEELTKMHESLRTFFEMIEGKVVQKIVNDVKIDISYYDLTNEKGDEESRISKIEEKFVRPFDLGKAPLFRTGIIQVGQEKNILIFDFHHIICDGMSMRIIMKDFIKAYNGEELPKLKLQYKDFAAWQNKIFKSENIKKQEEYWIKQFNKDAAVLDLPTDYNRPKVQSFEGNQIYFELDKYVREGLEKVSQETKTTKYMLELAAFNILLYRYSGNENIIVGSPIAVRKHADLENIVGMFMNTLPIRNFPSGNKKVSEFIKEVKANAIEAYENQDYPLEELITKIKVNKDKNRNPLFDVMLIQQDRERINAQIPGLTIKPSRFKKKSTMIDISMYIYEEDEKIILLVEYCTKLYKKETIKRMVDDYVRILKTISSNLNVLIKDINLNADVTLLKEVSIDVNFNI
ncbi:amino acid adenylation domain-containing protein [Clostridium felsineum]|uniref:non-ribosomal peptide synthetase/type I polyketide synthase n=1 Tax=Clostridium felsineum TaxID=36839 RepID=UPI00214D9270|nr:non-ribosomal peptide synthetase/type I polyketide synthase [Clostridium felsineum]MCR3758486.1 amino acid adenylation domain-containing protein [Clostridium felsineum]